MYKNMKKKIIFCFITFLLLCACNAHKENIFDDWQGLKEGEFDEAIFGVQTKYDTKEESTNSIENLNMSNFLVETPQQQIGNGDLISFSVTEEVSLKDVFMELGRLADIDIQIDPKINKGIIFKATEKPLNVILDKICDLAGLKYKYDDGILKIERDIPYSVNYDVDILKGHELWDELQKSIDYILEIYPVVEQNASASTTGADGTITTTNNDFGSSESYIQKAIINIPAGIISVYANSKAQKAVHEYIEQAKRNYGLQVLIEAKIIEVELNDSFQSGIDWSLAKTDLTKSMQNKFSLISGNILDLSAAAAGSVAGSGGNGSGNEGGSENNNNNNNNNTTSSDLVLGTSQAVFSIPAGRYNLNAAVSALSEFGKAKTLSSPRVSTLNNQTATLDFTNTLVYFTVEKEDEDNDDGSTKTTKTSTKQEDTEGVKLEITPSINYKTREVTLTVKPEIRVLMKYIQDPIEEDNKVPQIQTRKIETSLKLKSGDTMVIGGLIKENVGSSRSGIPVLKDLPIIGYLFGMTKKTKTLNETVIFIRATIVDNFDMINSRDKKFLKTFDVRKDNN